MPHRLARTGRTSSPSAARAGGRTPHHRVLGGLLACLLLSAGHISSRCETRLEGVYTIGGASPSFASFADAVNALRTGGVSGPAVFNVRPGTYTEQLDITRIAGASTAGTIVFQSENGSAAGVVLQFAATTAADNYVVRLNGASHVRFERMSFSTAGFGAGFRRIVVLKGRVDDVRLQQDSFTGYAGPMTSDPDRALVFAAADTLSGVVIALNTFTGGSWAVSLKGISNLPATDTRVVANTVGSAVNGIMLNEHDAPVVDGNAVSSNYEGIGLYSCVGPMVVTDNKVDVRVSAGISLTDCVASSLARGRVADNFVIVREIANGVYTFSSRYVDIYFNSVQNSGSTISGYPFFEAGGSTAPLNVIDNLFINAGTGYAYYVAVPAGIAVSDANDLHTIGSYLARWGGVDQIDLAALQGAGGKDQHSISRAVAFASSSDLHLAGASLGDANLRGMPLSAVPLDIDGDTRSAFAPYMGADEATGWPLAVGKGVVASRFTRRTPFPNPTRSRTEIEYALPGTAPARLAIFDVNGRRVRTLMAGVIAAGVHRAIWDGRDDAGAVVAPGAYYFELEAGSARISRSVFRLR